MNAELWRVQMATGEVRLMTLDDLDRSFDQGVIHSRTNVLAPGSFTWTTLGDAAGLEEPDPTPSLSPMALSGPSSYALPEIPQNTPFSMASFGVDDDPDFAPRRKRGLLFGVFIAGLAGVAAFFVSTGRLGGTIASTHTESKAVAAAVAPPPETKLPAPAPKAPNAEEKPKAEEPKPSSLADDVKKKLLDADKAREDKLKAKAEKVGKAIKRRAGGKTVKGADGKLVEGGDKYDPLNGSL